MQRLVFHKPSPVSIYIYKYIYTQQCNQKQNLRIFTHGLKVGALIFNYPENCRTMLECRISDSTVCPIGKAVAKPESSNKQHSNADGPAKKLVELKSNPVSNMNSPRWNVEKPDSVVITMFAKNISVFLGVCGRTCMQLCTSMQVALQPSCLLLWTWAGMEACGPTLPKDGPSKPHLWWGKVDRCRQHATVSNKWLDNIFTQSRGVQPNIIQEGSAPKEKMVAHNHKQFHARAVCEKPKFVLCVWKPQRQCQWPKTLLGQRPKIIEAPPPWTPAAVPAICKKMDGSPCHSLE